MTEKEISLIRSIVLKAIDAYPIRRAEESGIMENLDFDACVGSARSIGEIDLKKVLEEGLFGFIGDLQDSRARYYVLSLLYFKYLLQCPPDQLHFNYSGLSVANATGYKDYKFAVPEIEDSDPLWRVLVCLSLSLLLELSPYFHSELLAMLCVSDWSWSDLSAFF